MTPTVTTAATDPADDRLCLVRDGRRRCLEFVTGLVIVAFEDGRRYDLARCDKHLAGEIERQTK